MQLIIMILKNKLWIIIQYKTNINNENNNIINKFNMIFNIYKKLNINEIKITLKVDQKDINKEI